VTLAVPVCAACGNASFPRPLLCPFCGGADWRDEAVDRGILEARTENTGTVIGSVRLAAGPLVIVRLERDVPAGSEVELDGSGGAVVAR
jgi:uncharacterized protein